jgi:hypothetical protein
MICGYVLRKVIRKLLVRMIMFASVLLNSRQQSVRQERNQGNLRRMAASQKSNKYIKALPVTYQRIQQKLYALILFCQAFYFIIKIPLPGLMTYGVGP